jgi:diguanylate cyclase (GGDEF)-like protein
VGQDVDVLLPRRRTGTDAFVGRRREVGLRRRDGTEEPVEISVSEVHVGERRLYVGIARDVTQRKQEEEQLRTAAHADTLTGLLNRASFHRALAQRIEQADSTFAVLFLDLDGFKAVNDSLGHPVGDVVLQQVASRLTDAVRRHDLVARYGGDEFVVVVSSEGDVRRDAEKVAQRIRAAFREPFALHPGSTRLDVSIGCAWYPDDGMTISALISHADRAMYDEKRAKR